MGVHIMTQLNKRRGDDICLDPEVIGEFREICHDLGDCCGGPPDRFRSTDDYSTSTSSETGQFWEPEEKPAEAPKDDDKGKEEADE